MFSQLTNAKLDSESRSIALILANNSRFMQVRLQQGF